MSHTEKLYVYDQTYPLVDDSPDVYFCDFINDHNIRDQVIFHFGTGGHHIVGRRNINFQPPNHVLAVTASEGEYSAYIKHIIDNPHTGNYYKVLFLDIYTLSERILPRFDVVTLFHLCECYENETCEYSTLDDRGLLDLFISRLQPNGQIIFFRDSVAAEKMQSIVNEYVDAGKLVFTEAYKTLLVYRLS
jgi:hypothetical protein